TVVFGVEVVIQKNRVVGVFTQELLCLLNILRHVNKIPLETYGKPFVPTSIIVEKKNPDWIALD
ncbi:MAG TPA: hypothetical protein VFV61_05380, partial [Pyrinomonadaceae bacterium]|nr:hypothetical protein [Pyrinomonadaceae bacterium]